MSQARLGAHAVILNPRANGGNGARRWRSLLETEQARSANLANAPVFDGSGPGGLSALGDWLGERLRSGARHFVAAGGDGTVHLAVNELMRLLGREELPEGQLRLGAVGLGSSNDFHKPHGLAGRERAAGLPCRLDFANACAHDLGRLRYGDGDDAAESVRHFAINASVGVTAEANRGFNEAAGWLGALKRTWVDGAILATALRTFGSYRNFEARIQLEGEAVECVRLTNLGVVKNTHFSGQMRYDVPQARDDGRFGVHLCRDMSRVEMVRVLAALSSGRFQGIAKTSSRQASRLRIEADTRFAIETDGEVVSARRAVFEVLRREIHLCP